MSIRIRGFEERDAREVSRLIQRTMLESNSGDYPAAILQPLTAYFTPEKVAALAGERYCLVAEGEESLLGTAALEGSEIQTCFVLPDAQGQGVGRALLAELESEARRRGLTHLRVTSSLTGAPFYARLGFVPEAQIFSPTAGEQTQMGKRLDSPPGSPR